MHITLSEKQYETVMNALLNAQHDFAHIHGLRVTESIRCIEKAISILDDTYKNTLDGQY